MRDKVKERILGLLMKGWKPFKGFGLYLKAIGTIVGF